MGEGGIGHKRGSQPPEVFKGKVQRLIQPLIRPNLVGHPLPILPVSSHQSLCHLSSVPKFLFTRQSNSFLRCLFPKLVGALYDAAVLSEKHAFVGQDTNRIGADGGHFFQPSWIHPPWNSVIKGKGVILICIKEYFSRRQARLPPRRE